MQNIAIKSVIDTKTPKAWVPLKVDAVKMKKPKKRTLTVSEKQIAYGMFGGLLIGIFTDNIGLWISLGLVFGAGYSSIKKNKK